MYAYEVKPGDTPKEIARQFTGNGDRVSELIVANPQKSWTYVFGHPTFTTLYVNEVLMIPNQWLALGLAGVASEQVGVGKARTKQLSGFEEQSGVGRVFEHKDRPSSLIDVLQAPNQSGLAPTFWRGHDVDQQRQAAHAVHNTVNQWMRQGPFGVGEAPPAQNTALRAQLGDANSWRTNLADGSPDEATKIASYLTSIKKSQETAQEATRIAGVASNKWPNRVDIKAAYTTAGEDEKYIREIILPAATNAAIGAPSGASIKSLADSAWTKAREAVEKAELAETLAASTPHEGGPVPVGGYSFDTHGCLTGAGVKHLQNTLHALGFYDGPIDGVYTYKTGATWLAVTKFQAANGLTADGCAGKMTMAKLDNVLAGKPAQTAPTPAPVVPAPVVPLPVPGPEPVGPGADPVAYKTTMDWTPWLVGGAALLVGGALVVYMQKQKATGAPLIPKKLTSFGRRLGKRSRKAIRRRR